MLLKPNGLYPTKSATEGNKPAKLKAIAAALKRCDQVILATDCDREGQLIGQEILEHLRYRGTVQRALFTAQDPKSLRQAFDKLKPNRELRPLYEAAVARQQADQIFNLSLTRTATWTLLARGVKGVIGIGRVKTPTLAIVCLREIEIRDFRIEDYFEIVATAKVEDGTFLMRHAPPAKARIRDRAVAEAIAKAAAQHTGPLAVSVEHRRQAPPRLFDLPSLQKTCGQRWGWTADKTLAIAQETLRWRGQEAHHLPPGRGPPSGREPDRRRAGHRRRHDPAARLRTPADRPARDPPRQVRALLRQGARRRVAPCHRAQRQCDGRPRGAHRPPQRDQRPARSMPRRCCSRLPCAARST